MCRMGAKGMHCKCKLRRSEDMTKTVRLLLAHGADVNALGGLYGNALQATSFGGHDVIVRLLLEHGADMDAKGGEYGNALYAASSRSHYVIVQLLLERGADVNAQGGHWVCVAGRVVPWSPRNRSIAARAWRGRECAGRILWECAPGGDG